MDKLKHFLVGAALAFPFAVLGYPMVGLAVAAAAGIAKEVYDARTHEPEMFDALTTAVGGVVPLAMLGS